MQQAVGDTKDKEERKRRERAVLDEILPEAFAVVREASVRTTGMRHFDVQLIGGIVLHQGKIAEMRTGEGKTLVATLPSYLNALTGRGGVHVAAGSRDAAHALAGSIQAHDASRNQRDAVLLTRAREG